MNAQGDNGQAWGIIVMKRTKPICIGQGTPTEVNRLITAVQSTIKRANGGE